MMDLSTAADLIGIPSDDWHGRCHEISLMFLSTGIVSGRVARGTCRGVYSQHSWIATSGDCYDRDARIVDPTLWTYRDDVEGIWEGTLTDGLHTPHGAGSIWEYGRPAPATGPPIYVPTDGLSDDARLFLDILGPLDRKGWMCLATDCPVEGWPAGEIYEAMTEVRELSVLVPIDRLGMLTDLNPGGVYLPEKVERVMDSDRQERAQ